MRRRIFGMSRRIFGMSRLILEMSRRIFGMSRRIFGMSRRIIFTGGRPPAMPAGKKRRRRGSAGAGQSGPRQSLGVSRLRDWAKRSARSS